MLFRRRERFSVYHGLLASGRDTQERGQPPPQTPIRALSGPPSGGRCAMVESGLTVQLGAAQVAM
eukprot:675315-Alexandrium_andersonii.AAC.1